MLLQYQVEVTNRRIRVALRPHRHREVQKQLRIIGCELEPCLQRLDSVVEVAALSES